MIWGRAALKPPGTPGWLLLQLLQLLQQYVLQKLLLSF